MSTRPSRAVNSVLAALRTWAATGLLIVLLGVLLTSPPIVFLGVATILVRVLGERWPRRVLESLDYQHTIKPSRTVVGEDVELTMSLWNRSRLPVAWAGVQETLGPALRVSGREGSVASLGIAGPMRPYERLSRRIQISAVRRGVHDVGPARVRVAEIFGSGDPGRDPEIAPALLIARPLSVPLVGAPPASAPLAQSRARRSLFHDPALFAGTRPFQAGDPIRSIHWRASARVATLQAKRYEPTLSRQHVLVFDVQTIEGEFWELVYDEQLFEDQCVAALSLARSLVAEETAVGFAAAGFTGTTQRYVYLPPRADSSQIGRIGDALARLGMESSAALVALLATLPLRVARGTTLVVLTGRSPLSNIAVVRRLAQSGFAVHFLVMPEAHDSLVDAHRAGLSAQAIRVQRERRIPRAVLITAA
ncbi:MAG: DUF58 domain-containing protein [Chloroflexota bacterium]